MSTSPTFVRLAAACVAVIASAAAFPADATQASTTFRVLLEVASVCTVDRGADVDFGQIAQSTPNQALEASGSLVVRCNVTTPYSLALDKGLHGDSAGNRWMAGPGGHPLPYLLYSGPAGNCSTAASVQWGDGDAGTCILSSTNTGVEQHIRVVGRTTLVTPVSGAYSDTVTATLTY